MEHTRQSISPIVVNRNATAFLYYTLMFRMFVAIYVMSSLFRVLRFVLRRWRVCFDSVVCIDFSDAQPGRGATSRS
jgi:hypothetical protein